MVQSGDVYSYSFKDEDGLDFGGDNVLGYKIIVILKKDLNALGYGVGYPQKGGAYDLGEVASFRSVDAQGQSEATVSLPLDFSSSFHAIQTDGFAKTVSIGNAALTSDGGTYLAPAGSRVAYQAKAIGGLTSSLKGLEDLSPTASGDYTYFKMPDKDISVSTSFETVSSQSAAVSTDFDEQKSGLNNGNYTDKAVTSWNSGNNYANPRTVTLTYPTAIEVSAVNVYFYNENFEAFSRTLSIGVEVSEDGTDWVNETSVSAPDYAFKSSGANVLTLSKAYQAKAIRLTFQSDSYICLSEIATFSPAQTKTAGGVTYLKGDSGYTVIGSEAKDAVLAGSFDGTDVVGISSGSLGKGLVSLDASAVKMTRLENEFLFDYPALTKVTVPGNVDYVGDFAFAQSGKLASISGLDLSKATYIGKSAFENVPASFEVIPTAAQRMGVRAFANSGVTKLDLSTSTQNNGSPWVEDFAFEGAGKLTSVTLGNAYYIGYRAFANTDALKGALDLSKVGTIQDGAFAGSGIEEITLGPTVFIGSGAFAKSGLKKVNFKGTEAQFKAVQDRYLQENNGYGDPLFDGLEIVYVQ